MISQAEFETFSAAGYRVNGEAGTVDGVCHGVAFRILPTEGTLALSVNLSDSQLKKWQSSLPEGAAAVQNDRGVTLTLPAIGGAEDWVAAVEKWTAVAEQGANASFDNKFQKYRDPLAAYILGALGALLGAAVGVIPWILTGIFGFQLWIFGAFISIGSFFGYRLFRGAHATGFAVGCIIVCSLLAVLAGQGVNTAAAMARVTENGISFLEALRFCFSFQGLYMVVSGSLYSLIACALGFIGIRGKVMDYTHERGYLRRKK